MLYNYTEICLFHRVGINEVSSFQGVGVPLYTEMLSFKGFEFHCIHYYRGVLISRELE